MPVKRLSPLSDLGDAAELPLKKTHRTHEENQERAYIAASRRADRDIEHRIRSALKASECRRKRTGRGLKITREAVLGDEQYESEEDDHTARRFSMPAVITSTTPTTTRPCSDPFVPSREDRYAQVDALFKKHFPNVQLSSRHSAPQTHRHSYPQPLHLRHPAYASQLQYSQDMAVHQAAQKSPMLTPPTSYPLPPVKVEKSGSMSPLELELRSRRGSVHTPQVAADAGVTVADTSMGSNYLLADDGRVEDEGEYFYSDCRMGLIPSNSFSAVDVSTVFLPDDDSWYTSEQTTGAGWHGRQLSLSSALEQFQFPVGASSAAPMTESQTLVDPALLPSAVAYAHASAQASRAVSVTPPNEPWAEWVDLDGGGIQQLGVAV
ncbi:hypothetical protein N658DRAFT_527534 [Parathielavia hyrcaniae]|uniref:Uncharacterized protein n=1 Tax=Parathielavia hyrcaniae TaxID=113614 RepID=A0AAN6SWT9_9PEZI|nr:hypothetical protein N658DRAFT_527534 [Parathielavia hyrcaniae]